MSLKFSNYIIQKSQTDLIKIFKEVKGLVGIPDYLIYYNNKMIISIELKIKNWKKGLEQAFKYRTFSNMSYLIIADDWLYLAKSNLRLFKKYNIGLASFDNCSNFKVFFHPKYDNPFSTFYLELLNKKLLSNESAMQKFLVYETYE